MGEVGEGVEAGAVEVADRGGEPVLQRGPPAVGEGGGSAREQSGDAAGRGAVGVGVQAARHRTADGAGEVAVRVGEGGGDQGGVGDGVHPVVGGGVEGVECVHDVVEVL